MICVFPKVSIEQIIQYASKIVCIRISKYSGEASVKVHKYR